MDGTSGDAIAAASGLSKRTVWRYFRSKEACAEPLFLATGFRFFELLRAWPRDVSLESYLHVTLPSLYESQQELGDAVAAARMVALFPREPALRSAYLMAGAQAEAEFVQIVAKRSGLSAAAFEVRLCAATVLAAVRIVDEEVCCAAINDGHEFEMADIVDRLAGAIRTASTLPICDPVAG